MFEKKCIEKTCTKLMVDFKGKSTCLELFYALMYAIYVRWIFIFTCIYPSLTYKQDLTQGQFLSEVNRFEFRDFLLFDWLTNQGWRARLALQFIYSWRENNWIHTFPKDISSLQNVSPRIWSRVTVSISCDGKHYTTKTSKYLYLYGFKYSYLILIIIWLQVILGAQ